MTLLLQDKERSTGEAALGQATENGQHAKARKDLRESLLNPDGFSLNTIVNWPDPAISGKARDEVRRALEHADVFLPVYNQQETVGLTIDYAMNQHGIPPERITAVNCSDAHDRSGEIMVEKGIKPIEQWDMLKNVMDIDRFKDLCQVNDIRDLRGKGLTMFTGYLHRYLLKQQGLSPSASTHVIQTDTDIANMGAGPEKWDPLSYFAYFILRNHPDVHYLKAAKVGRNNEPFYVFNNALGAFGSHGLKYKEDLNKDIWPLTGEYGFNRQFPEEQVVYPSGYPIEMLMNMRRAELNCLWKQVSIPEARRDGQNDWNKEIPMYADIQRMMLLVLGTRKQLDELSLDDLRTINGIIAEDHVTYVHDTKQVVPANPKALRASRLMGSIPQLQKAGIIYSGK